MVYDKLLLQIVVMVDMVKEEDEKNPKNSYQHLTYYDHAITPERKYLPFPRRDE